MTGSGWPGVPGPALLFCPADRPDRYGKALAAADGVILDLEDAVAPDRKDAARRALVEHPVDPERTVVRVNPAGTADHRADLAALAATAYRTVLLAKAESPGDLTGLAGHRVVALCETPRGVSAAAELARAQPVVGLMWGSEDLVAGTGGTASRFPDGTLRDLARWARVQVLLAAAAEGKAAVDTVHLDVADEAGLAREAEDAFASGFAVKACIHPRQVPTVRTAARPSAERAAWARRVLDAVSGGVALVDGVMVDEPLLRQARTVLARAGGHTGTP
ncbi:HpcH/HpaI aldolase/citrate lyase family protein [Nakamurella endophytica]|uniref:Citrate lyase subunit beta-like protein n=1 Tax=Nakamurella endophytica TaxID=1748367 RepID=A0A917SWS1_9ACTN|nr:CoA ester lyase [Nakamurella endophytica]GGM00092.1 citrate lyase subunit beta-like protein [Nakamurella endophytica]